MWNAFGKRNWQMNTCLLFVLIGCFLFGTLDNGDPYTYDSVRGRKKPIAKISNNNSNFIIVIVVVVVSISSLFMIL